ncbi:hypothetical protein F4861DRAFT_516555 [Xylaria intraflava]|nr:hypothetical protein F4861DRAFT_516555 [Xylaria intraflava]
MDRLPLELLQRLLTHLDIKTLRNAALSCRIFFNAFKSAEAIITGQALLRQINYEVLPEAILVDKSWGLNANYQYEIDPDFTYLNEIAISKALAFTESLKHREPAPTRWKLVDALRLAEFHGKVSYLASQAAHQALEKQPRLLPAGESPVGVPTCEEMCRFERALYRFQLYCNVVHPAFLSEGFLPRNLYFEYFAPWEIEQLACIHEHLVRVVSKPFNEVVDHDVLWGGWSVSYISEHPSRHAEGILSKGIERIYDLLHAVDYTQRHALLVIDDGDDEDDRPLCAYQFLADSLEWFVNPLVSLPEMDEHDVAIVRGSPFYEDPDPGPASMWEWVYRNSDQSTWVADPGMLPQRRWAFPFWDRSRLEAAGLLEDPEIPVPPCSDDPELKQYKEHERINQLAYSYTVRRFICELGGTGFYDPQDLSKIQWKGDGQPRSHEEVQKLLEPFFMWHHGRSR